MSERRTLLRRTRAPASHEEEDRTPDDVERVEEEHSPPAIAQCLTTSRTLSMRGARGR